MRSHGMMQKVTLLPFATIRMAGINRAQTKSRAGLRLSQSMRLNRGLLFGRGGGGIERDLFFISYVNHGLCINSYTAASGSLIEIYTEVRRPN